MTGCTVIFNTGQYSNSVVRSAYVTLLKHRVTHYTSCKHTVEHDELGRVRVHFKTAQCVTEFVMRWPDQDYVIE